MPFRAFCGVLWLRYRFGTAARSVFGHTFGGWSQLFGHTLLLNFKTLF